MDFTEIIQSIAVGTIPIIFAITLHEASHAYAARYFGDPTAYMLGRMTLNPFKHIDPVGTILIPIVTRVLTGFYFGWAKPVPVNFGGLRDPKRHMIWVAAAGPFANFVMMIIWAVACKLLVSLPVSEPAQFLVSMAVAGIEVNVLFMILNLFPILPLDGGRIVAGLLPDRLSYAYSRLEPYGLFILLGLMISGLLGSLMLPVVAYTLKTLQSTFGF